MKDVHVTETPSDAIAIIGMACHFPGAPSPEHFWQLLSEGREALTTLSREALLEAGVPPALIDHEQAVDVGVVYEPCRFPFGHNLTSAAHIARTRARCPECWRKPGPAPIFNTLP